jgi:unsaturated chondroitin disaccharide hydrolase
MYTVGGRWNREGERWTHWCEGFFPGILWLLHKHTAECSRLAPRVGGNSRSEWPTIAPEWRTLAERYTRPLAPRRHDRTVHDLGFLFFSTYLRWYHLTGDPALRELLIDAGRTLALRRQKGGYLASFVGPQSLFIDIMMNVGIVFWAAREAGDDSLRQIALEPCRTTAKHLVRPDGGTAHEGIFDVDTGRFLRQSTHQGWNASSTWSRGLAWAIYGFTAVHRLSNESEFLDVARRCADYYLRHASADLVPFWDFDIPEDGPRIADSSAAAIAASGLWDLAEAVGCEKGDSPVEERGTVSFFAPRAESHRQRYQSAALTILQSLCSDPFLARSNPAWEGVLMHGVYHYHKGLGVDESVAWGDHFFVEALVKAIAGKSEAAW